MRIAVDAMGGDFAPRETVAGAYRAAGSLSEITRIYLVGDEQAIRAELDRLGGDHPKLEIRHASEVIEMDESPASAIRRKKDSSVGRAVDLVKQGEADAVVSAGHTGALVAAAKLKLRTLEGVDRPAIATVMPTRDHPVVLLDAGANIDASAELLAQFAVMGSVYSEKILHTASPKVGLLSFGGEESKGTDITRAAYRILEKSELNFQGNCEGHDVFEGETNVVVCDGFMGNVVLKTSESVAMAITHWIKEELTLNPLRTLGAALLRGAFRSLKSKMDPELYGGAPLLGVNGACIITHGASSSNAIYHAIRVAGEAVEHDINHSIVDQIARLGTPQVAEAS